MGLFFFFYWCTRFLDISYLKIIFYLFKKWYNNKVLYFVGKLVWEETMKKMLMMATTAAMIEQFNKNNILILEEMGYEVHVAGNFIDGNPISDEKLELFKEWLSQHNGKWFHIPSTRKPSDINNIRAYKQVVNLIKVYKYEFIHCHTPIGSVIARCAAYKTNTPIIYTAHGFHFYKGAPLKNWLLYYPIERLLSRWTEILITINKEDYKRAKKSFSAKRIEYVAGVGIDLEKFSVEKTGREIIRRELGLHTDDVVLLSVGELNKNKNHEIVIRALAKIKNRNNHYVIVGQGGLYFYLKNMSKKLKINEQVHLLGYRDDMAEIYLASDIFVFPSKREGLSVALMEAMASGLPVICSSIRGNDDLIENGIGGVRVKKNEVKKYCEAIIKLCDDFLLRNKMGENNLNAASKYRIESINKNMSLLYKEVMRNEESDYIWNI